MQKSKSHISLVQPPQHQELLLTKLDIPAWHQGYVSRPRLMTFFSRILQPGTTYIYAPAGYGKTIAVAEWIHKTAIPSAWFTLDSADNDPELFWKYLLLSVSKIIPGLEEKFTHFLNGTSLQVTESLLAAFLNELEESGNPVAIVLDDIHNIHEKHLWSLLIEMIDKLPKSNITLILMGRKDPVHWVQPVKIYGKMKHVNAEHLRFDRDEIRSYLKLNHINLNHHVVKLIESKTEGWVMGIVLAMRYTQQHSHQGLLDVFRRGDPLLYSYLADEVFSEWDEETQEFLLKTSILDRMTVHVCNALTGRVDSHDLLTKLSEDDSMVFCLNQTRGWYRYHKLLSHFLRHRLVTLDKNLVKDLYKIAGDYYTTHKVFQEAIHYYLKGRWFEVAAALILNVAPDMLFENKQIFTLKRWIKQFPERILSTHPKLLLVVGWISLLEQDMALTDEMIHKAESIQNLQGTNPLSSTDDLFFNELVTIKATKEIYSGHFLEAINLVKELDPDMTENFILPSVVKRLAQGETEPSLLAGRFALGGNLQLMEDNTKWMKHSTKWPAVETYGGLQVLQAEIHYQHNELDEATSFLMQGLQQASESQTWGIYVPAINLLSKIMIASGNVQEARSVMDHAAEKLAAASQPVRCQAVKTMATDINTRLGHLDAAGEWMQQPGLNLCEPVSTKNLSEKIVKCRILLHQHRAEQAHFELAHLETLAKQENRLFNLVEVLNLKAICNYLKSESVQAMHCFGEAIGIGFTQGYQRVFIDEGSLLFPVMKAFQREMKQSSEKNNGLMAYLEDVIKETKHHCHLLMGEECRNRGPGNHTLVEPLTERELQVLRCLAQEMTYLQVASQLGISAATVKVHARNLYGKLQVCNKMQAVVEAKELQLL